MLKAVFPFSLILWKQGRTIKAPCGHTWDSLNGEMLV